jgi:hypothetical protein
VLTPDGSSNPGVAGGRKGTGNRERKMGVWMNEDGRELEAFKRDIDVRQFAASLGYEIDQRESWRGSHGHAARR